MSGSRLAFGSVTPSKSKTKNSAQPLGDASQKVSAKAASFGLLQQHATLQLHARHYCTLDMSKNTHAHTLTHTLSHTQVYTYIHQHAYTHSLSHTHIRNKHTTHTQKCTGQQEQFQKARYRRNQTLLARSHVCYFCR